MIRRVLLIVVLAVLCGACAPRVIYRPVPLQLAPRPHWTPVPESAVQCLSPAAYTALAQQKRALERWGLANEATIKVNNKAAEAQNDEQR